MHVLALGLSGLLVAVCVASSYADFRHSPTTTRRMRRFGFPPGFEVKLGVLKLLAGFGLLIGRGSGPFTELAAWCLSAYFLVAITLHRRARDEMTITAPAISLFVIALTLALIAA